METTNNSNEEHSLKQNKHITKSELSNIRIIGGLAALFVLGSIIPYLGVLVMLSSVVLFLIAFYKISQLSGKVHIFNNILIAYLINIALILSIIAFFFYTIYDIIHAYNFDIRLLTETFSPDGSLINNLLMVVVMFYVVSIIVAFLWKRSLDACSVIFNEKLFATAGLLYIIGAFTIILCGVGLLVSLAGHVVMAIAFFSIKNNNEAL